MTIDYVELHEVGPREGFQYEGINDPFKIPIHDKLKLIMALTKTGLRRIQVASFVSPKHVPQMADAERLATLLEPTPNVVFTALYLNDKGFERLVAAGRYAIEPRISFTASEAFSIRNQGRDHKKDVTMQRQLLGLYKAVGVPVTRGSIMAAFGCNYEGPVSTEHLLALIEEMHELASSSDSTLDDLELADTMGWADPLQLSETLRDIHAQWPALTIRLHLHDTRGLGIANVYAGLGAGIRHFDTSVGGLGGCPFSGTAAGNVATEDVLLLCERLGLHTGVDMASVVECAVLAEKIVGHPLPSRMAHVPLDDRVLLTAGSSPARTMVVAP